MRFEIRTAQNEEKWKKKKRKSWGLKLGGVKMIYFFLKNMFCKSKKPIFFNAIFWLVFWLCILKMICEKLEKVLL